MIAFILAFVVFLIGSTKWQVILIPYQLETSKVLELVKIANPVD